MENNVDRSLFHGKRSFFLGGGGGDPHLNSLMELLASSIEHKVQQFYNQMSHNTCKKEDEHHTLNLETVEDNHQSSTKRHTTHGKRSLRNLKGAMALCSIVYATLGERKQ